MSEQPPAPLEWHPAYREKTWLLDWLEGRGPYSGDHLRLPIFRRPSLDFSTLEASSDVTMRDIILTKQKAWGPAPWIGRPFVYVWQTAIDDLGRSIAGEAHIVYDEVLPWDPQFHWRDLDFLIDWPLIDPEGDT